MVKANINRVKPRHIGNQLGFVVPKSILRISKDMDYNIIIEEVFDCYQEMEQDKSKVIKLSELDNILDTIGTDGQLFYLEKEKRWFVKK